MSSQEARKHAYAQFVANVPALIKAIESDDGENEMRALNAIIIALETVKDVSEESEICGWMTN